MSDVQRISNAPGSSRTSASGLIPVRMRVLATSIGLAMSISSCVNIPITTEELAGSVTSAIDTVSAESSNWQEAFRKVDSSVDRWQDDLQSTIKNEMADLTVRTAAAAREQFSCMGDFFGDRVKEGLERVKAKILRREPSPPNPVFCAVTPTHIDMNLEAERRNVLSLSGYNFDTPGLRAFHVRFGDEVDVTQHLTMGTHYHQTLNLGGSTRLQGVQLGSDSDRIDIRINGRTVSSADIVHPPVALPPVCEQREHHEAVQPVTFIPPHTRGDAEFFGNVDIVVGVSLLITEKSVNARIKMSAVQARDDKTTAQGEMLVHLYTAPTGMKIANVLGPHEDEHSYHDTADSPVDVFNRGGGVVSKYQIQGDHAGPDAGTFTRVTVNFNTLKLHLQQDGNCTP